MDISNPTSSMSTTVPCILDGAEGSRQHSISENQGHAHSSSATPVTNARSRVQDQAHNPNTRPFHEVERDHRETSLALAEFLLSMLTALHTFGIHTLLARAFSYQQPKALHEPSNVVAHPIPCVPAIPNSESAYTAPNESVIMNNSVPEPGFAGSDDAQWCSALKIMVRHWTDTCKGCVLILYLSLGLLQINDINGNTASRTTVISSFMCSGIGLMTGVVFLYADPYLKAPEFRARWVSASNLNLHIRTHGSDSLAAKHFWACLSLPLSLLAWSILFFVLSLIITICINPFLQAGSSPAAGTLTRRDSGGSLDNTTLSSLLCIGFLLALALFHVSQVIRLTRVLFKF